MKGARNALDYFIQGVQENSLEEIDEVYLKDTVDHLNLAKACFIDDAVAMNKHYSMDTASRELMSNKLHEYLNSEIFFDKLKKQKKLLKIKP